MYIYYDLRIHWTQVNMTQVKYAKKTLNTLPKKQLRYSQCKSKIWHTKSQNTFLTNLNQKKICRFVPSKNFIPKTTNLKKNKNKKKKLKTSSH